MRDAASAAVREAGAQGFQAALGGPAVRRGQVGDAADAAWAIVVGPAAHRAEFAEADVVAGGLVLTRQLEAVRRKTKAVDVAAAVVVVAGSTERVGCDEALAFGGGSGAGAGVVVQLLATAEFAVVAGGILAAATLGATLVVDAIFKGAAIAAIVAADHAGGAVEVAKRARQGTLGVALAAREVTSARGGAFRRRRAAHAAAGRGADVAEAAIAVADLGDAVLDDLGAKGASRHAGVARRAIGLADGADGAVDVATAQLQAHAQVATAQAVWASRAVGTENGAVAGVAVGGAWQGGAAAVPADKAVGAGAAARGAEPSLAHRRQPAVGDAALIVVAADGAGSFAPATDASVLVAKRWCRSKTAVDVGAAAKTTDGGVDRAIKARDARRGGQVADQAGVAGVVGVTAEVDVGAPFARAVPPIDGETTGIFSGAGAAHDDDNEDEDEDGKGTSRHAQPYR